jgi:methylamine dehydrogenase accessory protein MauD
MVGRRGPLLILLIFVVAILLNLARGRRPDCNCFGHLQPKPIGWTTVVRNSSLALCAGFVVSAGPARLNVNAVAALATALSLQPFVLAATSAGLAVLAAETYFLGHLFRQNGRLLLRMDDLERRLSGVSEAAPSQGLQVGDTAPLFELRTISGEMLGLQGLRGRGATVLLLFTDPQCGPCTALLPVVAEWQRDYVDQVRIAVISRGDVEANRSLAERYSVRDVLLQHGNEIADLYKVAGTPAGVLIRPDGTIATPQALGREAITSVLLTLDKAALPGSTSSRNDPRVERTIGLTYGTAIR